ncbi:MULTISPECIES: NAD(P)/FAD-dependent oxidoreductase [Acidobacteriaceae]|uniref:NAD(P)/FAD-dependent oxidoreductase n=1 Tax=Acidobacteriaceae TaxID=204434 RepID=UPI00131AC4A0|nr:MULTISPECIES: tryptophan 7-halogenase [Acidobacteriaceae]MDW5264162.1 tryptophan 7-halogenase [Edaphobacter sp.]
MAHEENIADVTVIGGGIAGMAASIHLARAGWKVLCVGPDQNGSHPVGESLDWSAPALLEVLGLPMERLIDDGIATYKRHVILKLGDGSERHYVPAAWLGRAPFNLELRTLHVDRPRLNEALREIAMSHGVRHLYDKVANVEIEGRRVVAVNTAEGHKIVCSRYIDASGSAASVLARAFKLPLHEYGPKKVAVWNYFKVREPGEGTTLYAQRARSSYMEWIWEVPINPETISVGYVTTGDVMKTKRQQGRTVEEIYKGELEQFPRFDALLQETGTGSPFTTSFRCRVYDNVAGPNWLIVGESAAMVDPMTSNGVTAALRHASEASSLLIRYRDRERLPWLATAMYSKRVEALAKFFNCGIEKVVYDWPVRERIGALLAGDVYTVPAWSMNTVYARIRPEGVFGTLLFNCLLNLWRAAASALHGICKEEAEACEVQA